MAFIIGISGPPGSGKTSLSHELMKKLEDSRTIHFDAYEQVTHSPMQDIRDWMSRGADPNEFDIPGLSVDLEGIRKGVSATSQIENGIVPPPQYVLFETPFGREHQASGRFIDQMIWIDVPLDLALARKLREFSDHLENMEADCSSETSLSWLRSYLDNYVNGTRSMLLIQEERISKTADFILDGTNDLASMVDQAMQGILRSVGR